MEVLCCERHPESQHEYDRNAQPCAAANPAIASRFHSWPLVGRVAELGSLDRMAMLPEKWSKFLLAQPETGMGYQIVAVTLRDGRVIEDVVISGSSIVDEVRGFADIPF